MPKREYKSFRTEEKSFLDEYGFDVKKEQGMYEQYMGAASKVRHRTPPFVNLENEGVIYDPVSKSYALPTEIV